MKGLGKFLFGGFLGALFGFLISPKRGQRVRDALLGKDQPVVSRAQPALTPVPSVTPPPPPAVEPVSAAPVVAPSVEPPGPSAVEPSAGEAPVLLGEPEAGIEYPAEPEETASSAEIVAEAAAPVAELEPEPSFEAVVGPEVAAPPAWAEPPAVEPEEPAVTQWATPAVGVVPLEAASEEALVPPDLGVGWSAPEPTAPVEAEEPTEEEVAGPGPESTADLKSRIEETRRRIQRELDHPFGGETQAEDVWAETPPAISFTPPAEVVAGDAEPAPAELTSLVKEAMFEPVAVHREAELEPLDEEPAGAVETTPWGAYEPVETGAMLEVEEPSTEGTGFEVPAMSEDASALAEPATPWGAPVTPVEQPVMEQVEEEATVVGISPVEAPAFELPVAEVPVAETPTPEVPMLEVPTAEQPLPLSEGTGHEALQAAEPLTEEVDRLIRDEMAQKAPAVPTESKVAPGEFDHEAMRKRIEETRNRLKAKAFDAMMSGETALLGRDSEDAKRAATQTHVQVDTEVAETIESTLTEEDL